MQTLGNVDTSFATKPATNAPPGSFAISAHEGPNGHPHQMEADPSNEWVVGTRCGARPDLRLETDRGRHPAPDSGCDTLREHAPGRWAAALRVPPQRGLDVLHSGRRRPPSSSGVSIPPRKLFRHEQQISSLPPGFTGTNFTSEIRVSADGDFVYGVNRLNDTIGVFRIGHDGRLTQVSHASTLGDYPRIFTIDPSGRFMVVGNQAADNVTTFRIEGSDPLPNEARESIPGTGAWLAEIHR